MASPIPQSQLPAGSIDILTLSTTQLSSLQSRLSTDLEHLTNSYTRLRSAQARFRSCLTAIQKGLQPPATTTTAVTTTTTTTSQESPVNKEILVPLTQSLYVPGFLSSPDKVIVDVGTGFYVEKSTDDALKFYNGKVEELSKSLGELENIVKGKSENLRIVEDVLRQKVLAEQAGDGTGASAG